MKNMSTYILGVREIDKTKLAMVGGKGANLGELSRMEGVQVPEGFCITTEVYKEFRSKSEKLTASFSNKEIKIIETYFLKAIEIMNETTNKLNEK